MSSLSESTLALLLDARERHTDGQLHEAEAAYRRVLALDPRQADAWLGLGMLARQSGARAAAIELLGRAVALAPHQGEFRMQLAWACQEHGRMADAAAHWQLACSLRADDPVCHESLGIALQALGRSDEALLAYQNAASLQSSLSLRAKQATLISPIVSSLEQIDSERARMRAALDAVDQAGLARVEDPIAAGLWTNFYLAYHGLCNRELQVATATMYRRICPSLGFVAAHCDEPRRPGRLRVGLISQFFHNHSIGRTSRGLFAQINRAEFELTALFIPPMIDDSYSRFILQHAEHHLVLSSDLDTARREIAALGLDVLFYQDIGMAPFSYFLAFARLAPVQCVSFGHPDTTGIDTIDTWISNDLYEPAGAEAHYSERLFRLHGLGTLAYYYRPEPAPLAKTRADFGLAADQHLYICPQNLFKLHPDMDAVFGAILRADPDARILLVQARSGHWNSLLKRRLASALPDVHERISLLPRMATSDYVALIGLCDVMLDTLHFNGMNTSLEAFSVGTPVVTLAGAFQRGRHTQAMYRRMGIDDAIAENTGDYVHRALALACDPELRAALSARILAGNGVLFEDPAVIAEFERCFRTLVADWAAGRAMEDLD